jgi:hypothetical protein
MLMAVEVLPDGFLSGSSFSAVKAKINLIDEGESTLYC